MIKMNNELISVIIPVYKVEGYLNDCVKSVVEQTYTNLEILLIDDGSPDNCPLMCDEWAIKDSRIIVIHKNNGGLSDARNLGLDVANGQYIMFVDSDDKIHPKMIEVMYNQAIKYNADIIVGDFIYTRSLSEPITDIGEHQVKIIDKSIAFDNLLQNKMVQYVTAWGKLYKKGLFKDIRYPVGKIYEDNYVSYKLYHFAQTIIEIPARFYFYLQREGSIMNVFKQKKYDDLYEYYFERLLFFKENEYSKEFERQKWIIEYELHKEYLELKSLYDIKNISIIKKYYRKYYFTYFNSFSWKYKIVGFINILLGRA